MKFTYNVEDIFEDIEDDEDNVLMNIPPEVMDAAGLEPGDKIKIEMGDQGSIMITKVTDGEG
jgi:hypothetical protein